MGIVATLPTTTHHVSFWRSSGAIILGYAVTVLLVLGGFFTIGGVWPDALPTTEGEKAGLSLLIALLALGLLDASVGGYVTATVAKRKELQHGVALIAFFLILGAISIFSTSGTAEPTWYQIATLGVGVIGVLIGAQIRVMQKAGRAEDADGGEPQSYHPAFRKGPQT